MRQRIRKWFWAGMVVGMSVVTGPYGVAMAQQQPAAGGAVGAGTEAAGQPEEPDTLDLSVQGGITVRPYDFLNRTAGPLDSPTRRDVPDYILVLRAHEISGKYAEMAQSLAKLIAYATNGLIFVRVEGGLNSIENIQDSAQRTDLFFFTALARDVATLRLGSQNWGVDHPYQHVRAVASLPPMVLQIMTQGQQRARSLRQLAGRQVYVGAVGSNAHRLFSNAADMLRLRQPVNIQTRVAGDDPLLALRRQEIDAYAYLGPLPNQAVQELSSIFQLGLVGYPAQDYRNLLESEPQLMRMLIPPHTYERIEFEVETVAEPVGIYTISRMLPEVVTPLTQAYWLWRRALLQGAAQPWWAYTDPSDVAHLQAPLHPSSLAYYDDAGVVILQD